MITYLYYENISQCGSILRTSRYNIQLFLGSDCPKWAKRVSFGDSNLILAYLCILFKQDLREIPLKGPQLFSDNGKSQLEHHSPCGGGRSV